MMEDTHTRQRGEDIEKTLVRSHQVRLSNALQQTKYMTDDEDDEGAPKGIHYFTKTGPTH